MECRASDRIPRLPVSAARKTFKETRATADPTEPSAARRFSRIACSIVSEGIRWIIRVAGAKEPLGNSPPRLCTAYTKQGVPISGAGQRQEEGGAARHE